MQEVYVFPGPIRWSPQRHRGAKKAMDLRETGFYNLNHHIFTQHRFFKLSDCLVDRQEFVQELFQAIDMQHISPVG